MPTTINLENHMKQEAREALIELLFLSLYLDDHLSLAEDDILTKSLDAIGWESPVSRDAFLLKAFSVARRAVSNGVAIDGFLESRAASIRNAGEQGFALTWLVNVLAADGLSSTEEHFIRKLEEQLFA